MIIVVFIMLALIAGCGPVSEADRWGRPASTYHPVPYDDTGHGGNQGGGGGGG
jgi:hypothetical protein